MLLKHKPAGPHPGGCESESLGWGQASVYWWSSEGYGQAGRWGSSVEVLALFFLSMAPAPGQEDASPSCTWVPSASLVSSCPSDTMLQPEELSRSSSSNVIPLFKNVGCGLPPAGSLPLIMICHLLFPLPGFLPDTFPTVRRALYPILCLLDHSRNTHTRARVVFPSPAPKPALCLVGEALLGHRHSHLCVPPALWTTLAPGLVYAGFIARAPPAPFPTTHEGVFPSRQRMHPIAHHALLSIQMACARGHKWTLIFLETYIVCSSCGVG